MYPNAAAFSQPRGLVVIDLIGHCRASSVVPFGLHFAFFVLCISMNPDQNPSSRSRATGKSAMRNTVQLHDGSADHPSFD